MALRIDKQEGPLGSLDEMRIQVNFKQRNGGEMITTPDSKNLNENPWVADSFADLPSAGDYLVLPVFGKEEEKPTMSGAYKVVGRHIDFEAFVNSGQRIICTILLETGTGY
jgi:hypothetical protein